MAAQINDQNFRGQVSSEVGRQTALVAGGAGFIGSFLCRALLLQGCRVIAVDNFSSGKKDYLKDCFGNSEFFLLDADLTKPFKIEQKVDYVFHLAGMEANLNASLRSLAVNSLGTENLLRLAKQNQAKFLLGSSVALARDKKSGKTLKDYFSKEGSIFSQEEAKRIAENLVVNFFKKENLDCRIVRLGWVYGPRMSLEGESELSVFFRSLIKEEKLFLPSEEKKINPSFISDVIYAIIKAMFAVNSQGKIFTLIDRERVSFLKIGSIAKKILNKKLTVAYFKDVSEEQFLEEEIKKTEKFLGWRPKVSLKKGIERTFDFFLKKAVLRKEEKIEEKITQSKDNEGKVEVRYYESEDLKKKPAEVATESVALEKLNPVKKEGIEIPKKLIEPKIVSRRPAINFNFLKKILPSFILVILTILFFLSPAIFTLGNFYWGVKSVQRAEKVLEKGEIGKVINNLETAVRCWTRTETMVSFFWPLARVTRLDSKFSGYKRSLDLVLKMSQSGLEGARVLENASSLGLAIMGKGGSSYQPKENLRSLSFEVENLYQGISLLEMDFASGADLSLLKNFGLREDWVLKMASELTNMRKILGKAMSVWPILEDFIGIEGKKSYLVLLQNNMELRPTGGFIGSFAILNFEKGIVVNFEIFDVYQADGQLKGHVEPPAELKKYLGEANWYLRDSNWDPNFSMSALKAEWFLEKEMKLFVDGVVAVNLNLAKEVLRQTGEMELSDYQVKVDEKNLFEKAEFFAETNTFAGSTQKKDFLASLVTALFEKMKTDSRTQLGFWKAFYYGLERKEAMVYLNEPSLMEVISGLGWEGSIREVNCPSTWQNCQTDYLFLVEANLGVNKVNYFIERNEELVVKLGPDQVDSELNIEYKNYSPSSVFPGGDYKNYLRVYAPLGSKMESLEIDGRLIAKEEITEEIASGKTVFGFLMKVPMGTKSKLKMKTSRRIKIANNEEFEYWLFLQKQSGVEPKELRVKFLTDKNFEILNFTSPGIKVQNGVYYTLTFDKDLPLKIRLKPIF